ncbi:MAG: TonB-dependent receptor [Pseudomonadota bacterium]|nr:TonB-dependent receptor [Pseudomonadota bacterium]
MTFKTTKLRDAIAFALVTSATALVGTGAALAQDTTPEGQRATELDRITVTGTRIKRVDVETASPVLQISREDIEATGQQTVGEILRNISTADNGGLSNVTSSTNANDGSQTISLRNLGAARTLVLVNGRRWVDGGGAVDLTTIPTAMIERIEVLKDGASAIYGSDAIAGVINIILRSNFDGATASAYIGQNSHGDGMLQAYDFTLGSNFDRGNVVISAAYTEQDPIFAGDREISNRPKFGCKDPIAGATCGSIFPLRGSFFLDDGRFLTLRPDREIPGLAPGARTQGDFKNFANSDRYNFAPENYLLTPSERTTFYAQGTYGLTDNINFNSTLYYNKRESITQIASVPLTIGGFFFGSGPQWDFPISANNIYNPFGVDIRAVGFRTLAIGPRTNFQSYDNYGFVGGFDGDFEFADRFFNWEAIYQHFESAQSSTGQNFINLFNLAKALGPSFLVGGVPTCGVPGAPIAGCVPVNLFNGQVGITQDMADYISYNLVQEFSTKRDNYLLNLSGDLFQLPGGTAGFAAGYEYRKDSLSDIPDSLIASGGSSTNFREPTSGQVTVDEFYLELALPLLSDVPFARRLELNLAGRYSDYKSSGFVGSNFVNADQLGDTTNYKFGFSWKPFEDLLVRGNYAETFRAPSVGNLFQGGGEGFPSAVDPCDIRQFSTLPAAGQARCIADGVPAGGVDQFNAQIRGLFGGNPNLQPEFGNTRTLGLVYSPSWVQGLNFTLDWWEIELQNGLAGVGVGTVLNRCYRENNPVACGNIERTGAGQVNTVRAGQENLQELRVEGYDFGASYNFETGFGRFQAVLDTSYTSEYFAGSAGAIIPPTNQVGQLIGTTGSRWRKRGNLGLKWSQGDWGASWAVRHFSSLQEPCNAFRTGFATGLFDRQVCSEPDRFIDSPVTGRPIRAARNKIPSTTYHDAQISFQTPYNSNVRVGVRNILDKDPPVSLNSFANSFLQGYDIPGRYYYLSYTQNF